MLLSDRCIKDYMRRGKIQITPVLDFDKQLGSCSVDFRLSNTFQIFNQIHRNPILDLRQGEEACLDKVMHEVFVEDNEAFLLNPGDFVLAATIEKLILDTDIAARLEGRSSLARLGIIVNSTSGLFDPGWNGVPTLELGNLGPSSVLLYPGMCICAFTFELLSSSSKRSYSKYNHQAGATPSKFDLDV